MIKINDRVKCVSAVMPTTDEFVRNIVQDGEAHLGKIGTVIIVDRYQRVVGRVRVQFASDSGNEFVWLREDCLEVVNPKNPNTRLNQEALDALRERMEDAQAVFDSAVSGPVYENAQEALNTTTAEYLKEHYNRDVVKTDYDSINVLREIMEQADSTLSKTDVGTEEHREASEAFVIAMNNYLQVRVKKYREDRNASGTFTKTPGLDLLKAMRDKINPDRVFSREVLDQAVEAFESTLANNSAPLLPEEKEEQTHPCLCDDGQMSHEFIGKPKACGACGIWEKDLPQQPSAREQVESVWKPGYKIEFSVRARTYDDDLHRLYFGSTPTRLADIVRLQEFVSITAMSYDEKSDFATSEDESDEDAYEYSLRFSVTVGNDYDVFLPLGSAVPKTATQSVIFTRQDAIHYARDFRVISKPRPSVTLTLSAEEADNVLAKLPDTDLTLGVKARLVLLMHNAREDS